MSLIINIYLETGIIRNVQLQWPKWTKLRPDVTLCADVRHRGTPIRWQNHSCRLQQTGNIATPKPEVSLWQPHIDLEGEKRNPEIYNLWSLSLFLCVSLLDTKYHSSVMKIMKLSYGTYYPRICSYSHSLRPAVGEYLMLLILRSFQNKKISAQTNFRSSKWHNKDTPAVISS